jgi:hypothetical protein
MRTILPEPARAAYTRGARFFEQVLSRSIRPRDELQHAWPIPG